jgi:repressor LexA
MRDKLPRRQEETLDHIITFVREHGHSPSIRDLCRRMNLSSPATVHGHLRGLAARGLISMPSRQSRSVVLSPYENAAATAEQSVFVPLVSHLYGSSRVLDRRNWETQMPLPSLWLGERDGNEWLLRVSSQTTIGTYHIGDYLLLRAGGKTPHDGEIVALPQSRARSQTANDNSHSSGVEKGARDALSTRIVLESFAARDERPVLGRVIGVFRPPL